MRVLIYGGRDFADDRDGNAFAFLTDLSLGYDFFGNPFSVIISGTAKGADQFGERWATFWKYPVERYPADWDTHGKASGHIRNQQMLDSGVDLAIQFPGGKGTADMRRRLDKKGVKVIEYRRSSQPSD